jgi:hypothetical protein
MACFEGEWRELCDAAASRASAAAAANRRQTAKPAAKAPAATKGRAKPKAPAQQAFADAAALGSAMGALSARSLCVGSRCEARVRGGEWRAGSVVEVTGGAFAVRYDDGGHDEGVPAGCIRVSPAALAAAAEAAVQARAAEEAAAAEAAAAEEPTTEPPAVRTQIVLC